jgi:hypothetical protein
MATIRRYTLQRIPANRGHTWKRAALCPLPHGHGPPCGPWRCVKAGAIISHFTYPWAAGKNFLSHRGMVRGPLLPQHASHVLSCFPLLDDNKGDCLDIPCLLTSGVSALQWMDIWMSRRQDS